MNHLIRFGAIFCVFASACSEPEPGPPSSLDPSTVVLRRDRTTLYRVDLEDNAQQAVYSDGGHLRSVDISAAGDRFVLVSSVRQANSRWSRYRAVVLDSAGATLAVFDDEPVQRAIWCCGDSLVALLVGPPTETDAIVDSRESAVLLFDPTTGSSRRINIEGAFDIAWWQPGETLRITVFRERGIHIFNYTSDTDSLVETGGRGLILSPDGLYARYLSESWVFRVSDKLNLTDSIKAPEGFTRLQFLGWHPSADHAVVAVTSLKSDLPPRVRRPRLEPGKRRPLRPRLEPGSPGRDRIFLVIDVETGELLDRFEAASNYWLTTNADRLPVLRKGRIELRGLPE